jgi:hypothetical protein
LSSNISRGTIMSMFQTHRILRFYFSFCDIGAKRTIHQPIERSEISFFLLTSVQGRSEATDLPTDRAKRDQFFTNLIRSVLDTFQKNENRINPKNIYKCILP